MFKFKKELSLKEAEYIAKDSLNHILDGHIVSIRRKNWVDNLFIVYMASFFYKEYQPLMVILDTYDYSIPYKCFYKYTYEEENALDWELVKIEADEYRQKIKTAYDLGVGNITPYDYGLQVDMLSNLIGMSYPTYTNILINKVDSHLDSRQFTGNYTLNSLKKISADTQGQSGRWFFKDKYIDYGAV